MSQTVTTYRVTGMTCGHCASAVGREVGAIAGVADVQVDLHSGDVTVASGAPLARDEVAAAVEEAGYELAS
ncbi:MAG TPA: heavy-metal-associated domain-containing protein [Marmoricola sp.]|nr:heavy-metal-associated domain-containing protein [Marmoricola sp.]